MPTENNSVQDGKLTDEQLGAFTRKTNEIVKRMNNHTLNYESAMKLLQDVVIQGNHQKYLSVAHGSHEIRPIEHTINCMENPEIPKGMILSDHDAFGILHINTSQIEFYQSPRQKTVEGMDGKELRLELKNKRVLNANVLDFFLNNQCFIPIEWRKYSHNIFFWGTTFLTSSNKEYIRCMYWGGECWVAGGYYPDDQLEKWKSIHYAAIY